VSAVRAYGACEPQQEAVQVSVVRASRPQRPWCKRQHRRERHQEASGLECACSQQPSHCSEGVDRKTESFVITKISDFRMTTAGIGGRGRPDRDPRRRSRLSGRWYRGSVRLTHGKPRGRTEIGDFRDDETLRVSNHLTPRRFTCGSHPRSEIWGGTRLQHSN